MRTSADATQTLVFDGRGLQIVASCAGGALDDLDVQARTTVNDAAITNDSLAGFAVENFFSNTDSDTGANADLLSTDTMRWSGTPSGPPS